MTMAEKESQSKRTGLIINSREQPWIWFQSHENCWKQLEQKLTDFFKEQLHQENHVQPSKNLQLPNQWEQKQAIKTSVLLRKAISLYLCRCGQGGYTAREHILRRESQELQRIGHRKFFPVSRTSSKQEMYCSDRTGSLSNSSLANYYCSNQ